jgi:hypothetical protein
MKQRIPQIPQILPYDQKINDNSEMKDIEKLVKEYKFEDYPFEENGLKEIGSQNGPIEFPGELLGEGYSLNQS